MLRAINLGVVAASLAGCGSSRFACVDDEACAGVGRDGQCEPDGLCSNADESCPSGRRYAQHAGDASGECVPPATTTGPEPTSSTTAPETSSDTSGRTTTSGEATTEVTTADSSTGPSMPGCIEDTFNGPTFVDGFCVDVARGVDLGFAEGARLGVTLDPTKVPSTGAYGSVRTCAGAGTWIGAEASALIVAVPTTTGLAGYLDFFDGTNFVGVFVSGGELSHHSYIDGASLDYATIEYDGASRWVRIRHVPDTDTIESEVHDGNDWVPLGDSPAFGLAARGWLEVGAGADAPPSILATATFDDFYVCSQ